MRRGDCLPGGSNEARPCVYTTCRHHTLADQTVVGRLTSAQELGNRPSCTLDVADEGEHTLEEVGDVLGLTRQRVEQLEKHAFRALSRRQER